MPPPGEGWKVFWYTMAGLGVSFAFFVAIKAVAGGDPPTMTKEWQEATNEYLKVRILRIAHQSILPLQFLALT